MKSREEIYDIYLKGNYTFDDGITGNADSLQRAEEKRKKEIKKNENRGNDQRIKTLRGQA